MMSVVWNLEFSKAGARGPLGLAGDARMRPQRGSWKCGVVRQPEPRLHRWFLATAYRDPGANPNDSWIQRFAGLER
jgi:hypothetical protein